MVGTGYARRRPYRRLQGLCGVSWGDAIGLDSLYDALDWDRCLMHPPRLYYFDRWEFVRNGEGWIERMSPRLLVLLDTLRHQWGRPIRISPHRLALGRYYGTSNPSQHNIDIWGEVRACDIVPDGIGSATDARRFVLLARSVGFTGIGFYPEWRPDPGFHVDVRHDKAPGNPSLWGATRSESGQEYVSLDRAMDAFASTA